MRYLDNFKAFESNIHEIGLEDDIENNCFLKKTILCDFMELTIGEICENPDKVLKL